MPGYEIQAALARADSLWEHLPLLTAVVQFAAFTRLF